MTPSIETIKNQILAAKASYPELGELNSSSRVSIYNLWAYIVATVVWLQYQFYELYKQEVDEKVKGQKLYTLLWFRNQALAYRHGHPLDELTGQYSDEGYTDEQISEALIVKRAAVIELELENRKFLFIKCATEVAGELTALDAAQIDGLEQYFAQIKPAGTKIVIFTGPPDDLQLEVDFFYDPLVLTATGSRIDGTDNTPVQNAIREYLANLRFNGEFSMAELEDILQALPGCANGEAYVRSAEGNYETPANWQEITSTYIANSGYMQVLEENLTITFTPKTVAL